MKTKEKCQRCKVDLSTVNVKHGAFIEGNFFRKGRWVYWCNTCKLEITPHYPTCADDHVNNMQFCGY